MHTLRDIWAIAWAVCTIPPPSARPSRHTRCMQPAISIQADSREECARQLDDLCRVLAVVPTLKPTYFFATGRWLARATVIEDDGPGDG